MRRGIITVTCAAAAVASGLALGLLAGASGCDLGSSCSPPCGPGLECRSGNCIEVTGGPPARQIGAACDNLFECDSFLCLRDPDFPGGYCSQGCGADIVAEGEQCPEAAACVQLGEAAATCVDLCETNADCRTGYTCRDVEGKKICYPGCETNADCPGGSACNTVEGFCESGFVAPGSVGATCSADADCLDGTGLCLSESASTGAFPGGYCTLSCEGQADGDLCPDNQGLCIHLPDAAPACFRACSSAVDCRPGYYCSVATGVVGTDGLGGCFPACRVGECDDGFSCDAVSGLCVEGDEGTTTVNAPTATGLGGLTGISSTNFDSVVVNVPADASGFSLIAKPSASSYILPTKVTGPSGQVLYDRFNPIVSDYKISDGFLTRYWSTLYPNSPRLPLEPGAYRFEFGADPTTNANFDVVFKRSEGVVSGGELPVVFWFTNGSLNSASAQTDPAFQQAVQIFTDIYAGMGIALGPFSYVDVAGAQGTSLAVVDDDTELEALFGLADGSAEPGLNIFFCDQFLLGGGSLLGISGGIPGPPSFAGLPHGGVAVALAFLSDDVGIFAETVAHEAGHYLGLYHLSERDGTSHDPLLDTPECRSDTNFDGFVSGSECKGKGDDYLMFWTTSDVPQRRVSGEQGWVVTRNPMVQ